MMPHRRLGSTDLHVSRLILGCGNFGGIGSAPAFFGMGENEDRAGELMDRAFDLGINVFDTADAYGGGRSESFIGRWLQRKGSSVRDRLILSTKVFHPVGDDPHDRGGLGGARITRQIDASLKRLHTDRVDMYLIHEPDPVTPLEETLEALDAVVRAGKVRYIGASNVDGHWLAQSIRVTDTRGFARVHWIQNSYSLLDRDAERDVFPACATQHVGVTTFSPLAGGWLTGKYRADAPFPEGSRMTLRPEPYRQLVRRQIFEGLGAFKAEADRRDVPMSTLATAWVLAQPAVDAIVIGPRRAVHLDEAIAALDVHLSPAEQRNIARLFPTEHLSDEDRA